MDEPLGALADWPAGDLQRELFRVMRLLVFRGHPAPPLGDLPLSQLRCLHAIERGEGLKMNELAESTGVKLPAMSQIVQRLVKRGMVERRSDDADRRIVRLYLTERARAATVEHKQARIARVRAAVEQLTPGDLPRVVEGLALLAVAAEQALGKGSSVAPGDPLVEIIAARRREHAAAAAAAQPCSGKEGNL